jgi:hypothetical protein
LVRLSLTDVMNLLDVQNLNGTPGQLERLRKWIESLVELRGKAFVREHRRNLLNKWELHMKAKSKSCC